MGLVLTIFPNSISVYFLYEYFNKQAKGRIGTGNGNSTGTVTGTKI